MLRRILLFVVSLISLTLVASVLAQDTPPDDQPVHSLGLAQELGLSQTLAGQTLSLDWAYADTQGFILELSLDATPELAALIVERRLDARPILRDIQGYEFSFQSGGFVARDTGSTLKSTYSFYSQAVRYDTDADTWQVENDYFGSQYESLPSEISLQLELNFVELNMISGPGPDGQMTPTPDFFIEPIGPFVFDFTLPLPQPVQLEPMQTQEVKGLAMTLETLEITPAHSEARLCVELPDAYDWQPRASILINGEAGLPNSWGFSDFSETQNTERRCFDVRFQSPYMGELERVVVSLDAIEKSMQEGPSDWLRIQELLAEQGIDMSVVSEGYGSSVDVPGLPEGMTMMDAINMAREELGERIVGPWVFEVELL